VTIQPAMVGDDLGTLQAAARAGGGICLLPDFAVPEDLERKRLAHALPGWRLVVPEAHLVQALTLPMHVAPQSARELVRFLKHELTRPGDRPSSGRRGTGSAGPPAEPP
jgi:DNA-binding transcriptional LysR family regulator